MLQLVGFYHSVSLCHCYSLCLLFTASISLPPISNFLRITRPSSEPGQWKTLLQIAPFTSRFSSQKTSSTSNLQVSKKSDGCQLRVVSKGARLSYMEVTTVMWSLQDTGKNWMTPYKNYFPDPIWEGIARCVNEIVLSLIMAHKSVRWVIRWAFQELSCLHFIFSVSFNPTWGYLVWFWSLTPQHQHACTAAQFPFLPVFKTCWTDWQRLALSPLRIFCDAFWRASLLFLL